MFQQWVVRPSWCGFTRKWMAPRRPGLCLDRAWGGGPSRHQEITTPKAAFGLQTRGPHVSATESMRDVAICLLLPYRWSRAEGTQNKEENLLQSRDKGLLMPTTGAPWSCLTFFVKHLEFLHQWSCSRPLHRLLCSSCFQVDYRLSDLF